MPAQSHKRSYPSIIPPAHIGDYVADIIGELAKMAAPLESKTLAALLELAQREAQALKNNSPVKAKHAALDIHHKPQ